MSDNPPHFAGAHRAQTITQQSRTAKHRKLRGALCARARFRARVAFCGVCRLFRAGIAARAAVAALLLAPVFHGVSQAAYFTQAEGLFNHVQLIGSSRDGQPPQLVVTAPNRINPTAAQLKTALDTFLRDAFNDDGTVNDDLSDSPGRGRPELFLRGIQRGQITLVGTGTNAQIQCTTCTDSSGMLSPYTSPANGAFFAVTPDRLDATQEFTGTSDRRVTFTIVSIDTGTGDLAAVPVRDAVVISDFTVYVNGVQATPGNFATEQQAGVTDAVSGLNADIVSASVIITNSADQPTSVTFSTSVRHMGTAAGRMQTNRNGHGARRTVTFAARQALNPVVNAGADQIITDDAMSFELSGTVVRGGGDSSGAALSYQWTQVTADSAAVAPVADGDPNRVTLSDASGTPGENGVSAATFSVVNVAAPTRYYFALRGASGDLAATDTVVITVNDNDAPTVGALTIVPDAAEGAPEGATATITASVVDTDSDPGLRYQWAQTSPDPAMGGNPVITFGSSTAPATVLTYPDLGARATQAFTLSFTVTDSQGLTASAATTLVVRDIEPPTIDTQPSISPAVAATGEPEGSAANISVTASDPDGDTLTYQWQQTSPTSPAITFNSPTAANTALTYPQLTAARSTQTFTVQVTVRDSVGLTASAALSVVVHDTTPPTAAAGDDQTADLGAEVTLDAGASRNAAGGEGGITYAWRQVDAEGSETQAAGNTVTLNTDDSMPGVTTFTAPTTISTLHFMVTVSDEVTLASSMDWVTITVAELRAVPPTVSVGSALRVTEYNPPLTSAGRNLLLSGNVVRSDADNPNSDLTFRWVQVASAAADAAPVATGAANRVTATAVSTVPGEGGIATATFTAPRVANRTGSENYFFRLIGSSGVSGQTTSAAATLQVTVFPPHGLYVTGGFPAQDITEASRSFNVRLARRHGVTQAGGTITVRASIFGNTAVAATAGEVPADFAISGTQSTNPLRNLQFNQNVLTLQYRILNDSIPEDEEGVGFNYQIVFGGGGWRIEYEDGFIRNARILDNDTITVGWSTSTFTANEGDGTVALTAAITSPASGQPIERSGVFPLVASVQGGGDAAAGSDYTAVADQRLTFGAAARTRTFSVPILEDTQIEADETFIVRISTATDTPPLTAVGLATATVTINDNDIPPAVAGITPAAATVNEGGSADFTLTLTGGESGADITVHFAVSGAAALTTDDYDITEPTGIGAARSTGTLVLTTAAGDTLANPVTAGITLSISDDNLFETAETLMIEVRTDDSEVSRTSVTIAASDRDITLQLVDAAAAGSPFPQAATDVAEGASVDVCVAIVEPGPDVAIDTAQAQVTLAAGSGSPTNAASASDFMIPNATLTLDNANRVRCHSIQAVQDAIPEPDQQFFVMLNAPQSGLTAIDSATVSGSDTLTLNIRDDDEIIVGWRETAVTAGEASGTATLTAEITSPASGVAIEHADFNLMVATADGTASAGGDYTALSAHTITLGNNTRSVAVPVTIADDNLNEAAETFEAGLGGAGSVEGVGLAANAATATVTIAESDPRTVSLGVNPASAEEGNSVTFTASMEGPSAADITVGLNVAGDAQAADRTLPAGPRQVVLRAGDTRADYAVGFFDDARNEATQTVAVTLGAITPGAGAGAVNAAASPGNSATAQILDDDDGDLTITRLGDERVAEGQSVRFEVTLRGELQGIHSQEGAIASEGIITATYTITHGAGVTGSDYTDSGGGSIALSAGDLNAFIELGIVADGEAETAETLTVTLDGVQRGDGVGAVAIAGGGGDSAGITIPENTSSAYTFSYDPGTPVTALTEGAAPTTYSLVIAGPDLGAASVVMDWAVTATAATGDVDISAADFAGGALPGGTLTFTAAQTTQSFAISLADDNFSEAQETFAIAYAITAQPTAGAAVPGNLTVTIADNDTARVRAVSSGTTGVREDGGPVVIVVDVAGGVTPTAPIQVDFTVGDWTGFGISTGRRHLADPDDYIITGTGVTSMIDDSRREASGGPVRADGRTGTIALNEANNFRAEVLFTPVDDNFVERRNTIATEQQQFWLDLTGAANAAAGGGNTGLLSGSTRAALQIEDNDLMTVNVVRVADVTEGAGATAAARIEFVGAVFDPYFQLDIRYSVSGCMSSAGCTVNTGSPVAGMDGVYEHRISQRYTGGAAPVAATSVTVSLTAADNNRNEADRDITIAWVGAVGPINGDDSVTAGTSAMLSTEDDDDILVSLTGGGTVAEDAGSATLTVSMDHASRGDITVPLTAGGTASTASDVSGLPAQVVIAAGQMSAQIAVAITDDNLNEAQETLIVSIGAPAGDSTAGRATAHDTDNQATITINDNDPVEASITAADTNVEEGDTAVFNIRLNRASAAAVTVSYNIGGTVTAPTPGTPGTGDYTDSGMGSITVAANTNTATLSLPIRADATQEPAETLTVTLTDATGAGMAGIGSPAAASVEIAQSAASVRTLAVSGPAALAEADATDGVTTGTYTVTLTGNSFTAATDVTWSVTHGGAEDADFANDSHNGGTVRFAANDAAAKTFMVGVNDDNLNEPTETFMLNIRVANAGADGGTGLPDALSVAITDDDVIEVTVDEVHADANRNEAANGGAPTTAVFSIALSGGVRTTTVTVPFGFSGDGITADDFNITVPAGIAETALNGEVVFGTSGAPAADDTMFVRAELQDDNLNEASESLTLTGAAAAADGLRTAAGGDIRYAATDEATTGTVVIIDSDPIAISISIANAGDDADDMAAGFQVEEGRSARFAVTLDKASAAQVTVAYAISGDVAAADYTDSGNGRLTIAAGTTAGEISIALTDDETDSSTESLVVTLSETDADHSAAGEIARSANANEQSATQEVISRLAARTLRVQRYTDGAYNTVATAAAITEGDANTTLYFAVDFAGADDAVFSAATQVSWTVEPAATNGAAAADFTALTGNIMHPANTRCTAATPACRFQVVITGDNLNEPDEGFSVTLSVADEDTDGGTNPGDGSGALTITDDDPIAVSVTAAANNVSEGGNAVVNVNLGAIPTQEVRIDYSGGLGATAAGDDVDATVSGMGADLGAAANNGVITIAANANPPTGSLTIPVTDDNLNESAETFVLALAAADITGAHGTASVQSGGEQTFTIAASDPITVGIERIGAATVSEGGSVGFRVALSGAADGSAAAITVPYTIGGASGFTPTDAGGGSLTIAAGETSGVITVGIPNSNTLGDSDPDQTLTVTLGNSPSAGAGGGGVSRSGVSGEQSASVSVEFSDAAHTFALTSPVTAIDEADMVTTATYTLTRNGPAVQSGQDLVITWAAVTGTAVAADFEGGSLPGGTLTYAGSATTATFDIVIAGDNLNEPGETFRIAFHIAAANQAAADANGGAGLPADQTVTINDDDVITYAIGADGSAAEGNPGGTAGEIRLPVTLSGGVAVGGHYESITVPFTIDDGGTAGAGDYSIVPNNNNLTFAVGSAGSLTADIVITATPDNRNEAAETVIIRLGPAATASRLSGGGSARGSIVRTATTADQRATATITDDDGLSVRIARRAGQTGAVTEGNSAEFTASLVLARDNSVASAAAADICVTFATAISTQSNAAAGAAANTVTNADVEVRDCAGNVVTTDAQGAASNGGVLIPAGQSEAALNILARYDDLDEGMTDEELTVTITAAAHQPALTGAVAPTIDSGNNRVAVNIENINEDIAPPRFDDPANQPGWSGGQQVLWVRMDEDFKVLPHPAGANGATVSTATPSLTARNSLPAGDFTVVENHGNPSSATIAVSGVTPFAGVRALRLELQRAIAADAANVNIIYERTGGANAIYDTAVEAGLARNNMRNATTATRTGPLTPSATADFDTDGIPDAVEAGIRGAAGNPFVDVTPAQQPAFTISRTTPTTSTVAYSGIREHGVRAHLGVSSVATTTQTAAQTITAYYRSATFGYGETYRCASGPFPANYDAPLADGGCAPVDWGDIAPATDHTIAWLARSADGVWAVNTETDSNLPEQTIRRIPELNMASQALFTTGTSVVVIRAFFDAAPATGLTLALSRTPDESGETTMFTGSGSGRTLAATDTSPVSALWEITGLTAGSASRLYVPNTPTAGFTPNYPAATDHSLGLARQTRVLHTGGAPVPPVLGRPVVSLNGDSVLALVEGNAASYTLDIPVENHDAIGAINAADAAMATHNNTLDIGSVAFVAAAGGDGDRYRYTFTMRGSLPATMTQAGAVIRATITGGLGGSATAVLRYPIVASGAPLATARADSDGDGIADMFDDYDARAHLPVVVSDDAGCRDTGCAGASAWHHIRPALPVHDLRLGEMTAQRLAMATAANEVDNYGEYSASFVPEDAGLEAVYDFEIGGVAYSEVSEDTRTGGVAGVIIPLPQSLAGSGASLVKHPSGRAFSVAGGNDYGFARLQEDGACPDDTMAAGSPYREGETLRRAKRGDDACLVVYIVDGGANDEDGLANGVIKDPLGIRAGNAAGDTRSGGAFGPATLTALAALAALLLLLTLRSRRRRRRR